MSEKFIHENNAPINGDVLQKMMANNDVYAVLVDVDDQDMSTNEITDGIGGYLRRYTSRDRIGQQLPGEEHERVDVTLLGSIDPLANEDNIDALVDAYAETGLFALDKDKVNIRERMMGGSVLMVMTSNTSMLESDVMRAQAQLRMEEWRDHPDLVPLTRLKLTKAHATGGARSHRNESMQFIGEHIQYEGIMNYSEAGK